MPIIIEAPAISFINFGDGDRDWANMQNISTLSGEAFCNTKSASNTVARSIVAREFSFTGIPKYSKVVGIVVKVRRRQSDNNTTRDDPGYSREERIRAGKMRLWPESPVFHAV